MVHEKMLLVVLWASAAAASAANPGCTCGSCYCDTPAACAQYGNCCADHLTACPASPPTPPGTTPGSMRWRFGAGGPGTSGGEIDNAAAVVAEEEGLVLFTSAAPDPGHGRKGTLYAVDVASGAEAWRWRAPNTTAVFTAPAAAGGAVFFASMSGSSSRTLTLHSLDIASGALRWSLPLPAGSGSAEGAPAVLSVSGSATGDAAGGLGLGLVFLATSGGTHAVRQQNGTLAWSNAKEGKVSATGAAAGGHAGQEAVFVAGADGALHALEAATGAARWSAPGAASEWARPVVAEVALDPKGSGTTTLVFSASGADLVATRAATGAQQWRVTTALKNPMAPAVDAALGRLFLAGTTDRLYALNASTGAPLWTSGALCQTHLWNVPAVSLSGDTVYVGLLIATY